MARDAMDDGVQHNEAADGGQPGAEQLSVDSASDQERQQSGEMKIETSDDELNISSKPQRTG